MVELFTSYSDGQCGLVLVCPLQEPCNNHIVLPSIGRCCDGTHIPENMNYVSLPLTPMWLGEQINLLSTVQCTETLISGNTQNTYELLIIERIFYGVM